MHEETHVAVKVWDAPIRIVHWAIVLLFAFQFVTGKIGGELMTWHAYCGYSILVLVVFRILWGFVGSTHARFASFLAGPAATLRFARRLFSRQAVPQLGHNPLGGWMVIALVACLAFQAGSGLFANDGASAEGPLASLVSLEVSNRLTELHRWNLNLLLLLAGIHIGGVLFHWFAKKDNLVAPMFSGVKQVPAAMVHERRDGPRSTPPRRVASRETAHNYFPSHWRALAILMVSVALVWVVIRGVV
jgi:cytochrome b